MFKLGVAYARTGLHQRALDVWLPLLPLASIQGLRFNLGLVYYRMNSTDEAIKYLQAAVIENPSDAAPHIVLAEALVTAKRIDEAMMHIDKAIELDNSNADSHLIKAHILSEKGDIQNVISQYRRVIELDPSNAMVHRSLADFLNYQKKYSTAIAHLRRAIELDPSLRKEIATSDTFTSLKRRDREFRKFVEGR